MGLFDTIRVEQRIPGFSDIPNVEFQTKSLHNALENYVITNNGELYREEWEHVWVEDSQHLLGGYDYRVPDSYHRVYLTDYHGDVIFYEGRSADGVWREYTARFTEGKLTRIWYEDKQY